MSNHEQVFTITSLRRYSDEFGPMYIAYRVIVFDVTDCPNWRTGLHRNLHFPGQDLTGELTQAPHGEEVFKHPHIKKVGILTTENE